MDDLPVSLRTTPAALSVVAGPEAVRLAGTGGAASNRHGNSEHADMIV
jgi:hypothetical protein